MLEKQCCTRSGAVKTWAIEHVKPSCIVHNELVSRYLLPERRASHVHSDHQRGPSSLSRGYLSHQVLSGHMRHTVAELIRKSNVTWRDGRAPGALCVLCSAWLSKIRSAAAPGRPGPIADEEPQTYTGHEVATLYGVHNLEG